MPSGTITRTGARRRSRDGHVPFLFVALRCDRPLSRGARIAIGNAASVIIGRAPALEVSRQEREVRIGLPDPRVSARHVKVEAVLGSFVAEDLGSKNGTFVDGRRISREELAEGAILELGDSFLLFRSGPAAPDLFDPQETLSPSFAAELERLESIAPSRVPVLLRGESGTGKEVLAAAIHRLSRRSGPFQAVNCGAIPRDLVESELFGHRKGAFSGALDDAPGLIRAADHGTLLLDEIGDLPLPAQAALLRVVQEEEVHPVGAARAIKTDLRIVAATHRDLDEMVKQGTFRADLLARLAGYVCTLPPLRERREDFSLFVATLLAKLGAVKATFTPEAARALLRHSWPLNVRELEKCLASAVALSGGRPIDLEHLPPTVRSAPQPSAPPADQGQRDTLVARLREHRGNISAVARSMGKARTQVQRWLRRYHLDPTSFR
jgi:DNA-binding NtrC family response regulator